MYALSRTQYKITLNKLSVKWWCSHALLCLVKYHWLAEETPWMCLYKTPHYILSIQLFGSDQSTTIVVNPANLSWSQGCFHRSEEKKDLSASQDPTGDTHPTMTRQGTPLINSTTLFTAESCRKCATALARDGFVNLAAFFNLAGDGFVDLAAFLNSRRFKSPSSIVTLLADGCFYWQRYECCSSFSLFNQSTFYLDRCYNLAKVYIFFY